LAEINPASTSSVNYALIKLEGTRCPVLHNGLCVIHQTLGEPWLPDLCSTYPRSFHRLGGVLEKSLQLSCPEAARLVLTNPDSMLFEERPSDGSGVRAGSITRLMQEAADDSLAVARGLVIEVIRDRSRPLWQRVVSLGFAIDVLAGVDLQNAVPVMEAHLAKLRAGMFDAVLNQQRADPARQLEIALELIVARLGADYTPPRFLECYRDLMKGLEWTDQSTMQQLSVRYQQALHTWFLPFSHRHEYLLENLLVNYIFSNCFPWRRKQPDQTWVIDSGRESMNREFLLLAVHYSLMRVLLIGMAAEHRNCFDVDHAVRLVQAYSKAFLHSVSFEELATDFIHKAGDHPMRQISLMVMD
jgi:lysine-N-methylase